MQAASAQRGGPDAWQQTMPRLLLLLLLPDAASQPTPGLSDAAHMSPDGSSPARAQQGMCGSFGRRDIQKDDGCWGVAGRMSKQASKQASRRHHSLLTAPLYFFPPRSLCTSTGIIMITARPSAHSLSLFHVLVLFRPSALAVRWA